MKMLASLDHRLLEPASLRIADRVRGATLPLILFLKRNQGAGF